MIVLVIYWLEDWGSLYWVVIIIIKVVVNLVVNLWVGVNLVNCMFMVLVIL